VTVPNIPGLGQTTYLLPDGQVVSNLPSGDTTTQLATPPDVTTSSDATGIFPTINPGGSITPASSSSSGGITGIQGTVPGVSAPGATPSGAVTAGAGVAAGTSGNPFVDAAEWAANLLGLVPLVGPGIAAVLTDGVQAVAYMTHDLAYALDTAVSVFKPGQAWRFVFSGLTLLLGTMAFRAWTGRSLMPSAPAVVPV
jgi:hypothetical protein